MAASHTAYRRIHLDLLLIQGSVCRRTSTARMCCHRTHLAAIPATSQTMTTHPQEKDHDRHHHRRDPRHQPLHP